MPYTSSAIKVGQIRSRLFLINKNLTISQVTLSSCRSESDSLAVLAMFLAGSDLFFLVSRNRLRI